MGCQHYAALTGVGHKAFAPLKRRNQMFLVFLRLFPVKLETRKLHSNKAVYTVAGMFSVISPEHGLQHYLRLLLPGADLVEYSLRIHRVPGAGVGVRHHFQLKRKRRSTEKTRHLHQPQVLAEYHFTFPLTS